MADSFTKNKFKWLDQVGADASLTPLCFRVAYEIVVHLNRKTNDAWPGHELLARKCNCSVSGVRKALDQLETGGKNGGHLEVKAGNGRSKTSLYKPILKEKTKAETCPARNTLQPEKVPRAEHLSKAKGATPVSERCPVGNKKGAPHGAMIPLIEPIEKEPSTKTAEIDLSQAFEKFWKTFPDGNHKTGKVGVERQFQQTIKSKKATAKDLIDGAGRYADQMSERRTDHKYIMAPARWLKEGHWADSPAPKRDDRNHWDPRF